MFFVFLSVWWLVDRWPCYPWLAVTFLAMGMTSIIFILMAFKSTNEKRKVRFFAKLPLPAHVASLQLVSTTSISQAQQRGRQKLLRIRFFLAVGFWVFHRSMPLCNSGAKCDCVKWRETRRSWRNKVSGNFFTSHAQDAITECITRSMQLCTLV
jgi:hypothetical protein